MTAPHPSLFRTYDIRGKTTEHLTADAAFLVGRAFASYLLTHADPAKKIVCVGYDGRLSSPLLAARVVEALVSSGFEVRRLGLCPTPMLYYATHVLEAAGGIMITGSHNPPEYNGFKMMCEHDTLYGEAIQELCVRATQKDFVEGSGSAQDFPVAQAYVDSLVAAFTGHSTHYMPSIAWDPGNGAAGDVLRELLLRLPGKHVLINGEIDGTFPAHHPDPAKIENLKPLQEVVAREHCDFGIAFDGDGDRIGVIDGEGNILWGDQLLYLFARDVLATHPGEMVIADVKASQALFSCIAELGGVPLMWKTGHSLIKAKMKETGAIVAGEMSGHIFFREHHGMDDALYAAVRLFNIVAREGVPLLTLLAEYPKLYATPELRIEIAEAKKQEVLESLKKKISQPSSSATVHTIDGLRVHTAEGWWLLRASNTEPVLVARVEAYQERDLLPLYHALEALVAPFGLRLPGVNGYTAHD